MLAVTFWVSNRRNAVKGFNRGSQRVIVSHSRHTNLLVVLCSLKFLLQACDQKSSCPQTVPADFQETKCWTQISVLEFIVTLFHLLCSFFVPPGFLKHWCSFCINILFSLRIKRIVALGNFLRELEPQQKEKR